MNKQQQQQRPSAALKKAAPRKKQGKKAKQPRDVSAPVATTRLVRTGAPQMSTSGGGGDGRMRIRHREYLADVSGSVAFGATQYALNPGLVLSFPWLSTIAFQFESYLFRSLRFEFETQKSTSTSGTVILAVDYDASDPAPSNKTQVMSYNGAVRSAVWAECEFVASVKDLHKFGQQRYLRYGNLSANQDIKTYDVGNLWVCTQGCADTTAIGELYVSYEVELMTPQINGQALLNSLSAVVTGVSPTNSSFMGTTPTVLGGLPMTFSGNTFTALTPCQLLICSFIVGTGINVGPALGGTALSSNDGSLVNSTNTQGFYQIIANFRNPGDTLTITFTAIATTITASSTRVASYDYADG